MDEFEDSLQSAGAALTQFVSGPGSEAASALEQAFARASQSIETALGQAAQSGELEFRRMTETVLADLARIAAEAVIARSGLTATGQTVNLNMSLGSGADAQSVIGASGTIASLVASAAVRGGRFA